MSYDVERTKRIQNEILDIMKTLHNILDENGFTYYLDAGSTLGAIRHNGFIPWDDDLDIEMPRKDYDRFMREGAALLPEHLYLQYPENEKLTHVPFAKVRLKGTLFEEDINKNLDYPKGIYIDIFPVDFVDKIDWKFKSKIKIKKFFWSMFLIKDRSDQLDIYHKLGKLFATFIPKMFSYKMIHHIMRNDNENAEYMYESLSQYKTERVIFKKAIFGKPTLHKFEDAEFYIQEKAEEYLTIKYGDYMKLPPEEKRGMQHTAVRILFDYDDSKYFRSKC